MPERLGPIVSGADPQMWLSTAERLFYGGRSLWVMASRHWPLPLRDAHPAEPGMFSVALLLFGYAMENALKGLIVQRRVAPSVRNKKGELAREIITHNLAKLADAAEVRLQREERDLLLRLKTFVEWAGRYPVMKDLGGLRDGQLVPNASFHPVDDR